MKYEVKILSIVAGTEKTVAILHDRKAAFEYAETMKDSSFITIYENGHWIANV